MRPSFGASGLETYCAHEDIRVAEQLPAGAGWAGGIGIRLAARARPEGVHRRARRLVSSVGPDEPAGAVTGDGGRVVAEELGAETVRTRSVGITECRAEQMGSFPDTVASNLDRGELADHTGPGRGAVRLPGLGGPGDEHVGAVRTRRDRREEGIERADRAANGAGCAPGEPAVAGLGELDQGRGRCALLIGPDDVECAGLLVDIGRREAVITEARATERARNIVHRGDRHRAAEGATAVVRDRHQLLGVTIQRTFPEDVNSSVWTGADQGALPAADRAVVGALTQAGDGTPGLPSVRRPCE